MLHTKNKLEPQESTQEVSKEPTQEKPTVAASSVETASQPVEPESLEQIGSKIDSLYQGDDNSHIYLLCLAVLFAVRIWNLWLRLILLKFVSFNEKKLLYIGI